MRHPLRIVLAGLLLGLVFDRLVAAQPLGVSFPLFVALVVLALALTMKWEAARPLRANLWVFAPLLFFAAMVAIVRDPLAAVSLPGYALSPFLASIISAVRGAQTARLAAVQAAGSWRGSRRSTLAPVLRGLLLALPVVIVFALLLTSADLMFAEVFKRLLPEDFVAFLNRFIGHGGIVLFAGFMLMGGLAYTVWRDDGSPAGSLTRTLPSVAPLLGLTESAVVLNAVNLLFAAFVVIQVRITYAEYARQGFGELVLVSILVLGMLLLLGVLTRREAGRQTRLFNLSSTVTVGLTVVILVSAFKRLLLYEMAYGFTEMRIYPHVFMVWLALLLGWFLVTLWVRPGRFGIGVLIACIGFVATLNLMNVDGFIVRRNVQRYEQLGPAAFIDRESGEYQPGIDAAYLTTLSADAMPALVQSVDRLTGAPREELGDYLRATLPETRDDVARRGWPGFHLAQWRAYNALAGSMDRAAR